MRSVPLILLLAAAAPGLPAQGSRAVEMHQAVLDLGSNNVAMNISAHPDDEDGATLALVRMKQGARTHSVFFTRGEGGQNEKGPELYEELGVLRTGETEAAASIQGTEAFFLNLRDFGYSKTATETFAVWGGQREPLRRLVYAFRRFRPDVVFTNHNTVTGHGHHQAAAITAIAAFDAAADSSMFPEQLREPGMSVWQPKKLFFRIFQGSERPDVVNAVGDTDRVRGKSYLDVAAEALKRHETQGMDRADLRRWTRGLSMYRLVRTSGLFAPDSTSFFGGIDPWRDPSLALPPAIESDVRSLRPAMTSDSILERCSRILRGVDAAESSGSAGPLRERVLSSLREETNRLASLAAEVVVTVRPDDRRVVPGQRFQTGVTVRYGADAAVTGVSLDLPRGWTFERLAGAEKGGTNETFTLKVPSDAPPTVPKVQSQNGLPEQAQLPLVRVRWESRGRRFETAVPLPVEVVPPEVLTIAPGVIRMDPRDPSAHGVVSFKVLNRRPSKTAGRLRVLQPAGWTLLAEPYAVSGEDSSAVGTFTLRPPPGTPPSDATVRIGSTGAEAAVIVKAFPVEVAPRLLVGIVQSYDTSMAASVRELGVPYRLLDDKDLAGDLSRLSAVLVDIRAYLVREDLRRNNDNLLRYAAGGGTVVVMYQRDQEWRREYAPYPFDVSRARVTVEDAPVVMLQPDHPLLASPNRITAADWGGWVQERVIYAPSSVAEVYHRLVSTGDPGEPPVTTAYLAVDHGLGAYVYTSFVWYRQLKELHPGALRCFANMLSYTRRAR